jgi:uncharacterized protein
MIQRELTSILTENLNYFPVTGLVGPRQVGKTTLAREIVERLQIPYIWLDLELEDDMVLLQDAQTYLTFHQEQLIVIDEIQRLPKLFPLLRALVDKRRVSGRFLILGSSSPRLLRDSSESLAGRIGYSELTPISLRELGTVASMQTHWLYGGFPDPLLSAQSGLSWRWMNNFLTTFLERDLQLLGYDIAPETLRRLFTMLTTYHGNLLNISELSRSMGLSSPTIQKYLDLLEGSFLIHRLLPFYVNIGKRLVKSPKFYFRDSGLFHSICGIHTEDSLIGHRYIGASWEGYVVEQIKRSMPEFWQLFFYRTQNGAEADLVLQAPGGDLHMIEIKYSLTTSISKGFVQSAADLNPKTKFVLHAGDGCFPRTDGTLVCGLREFLIERLPFLDQLS